MELYHALNRGVDKRLIVLDDEDRYRFVHDLYEFNDKKPAVSTYHSFRNLDFVNPDMIKERELIVDLHGWCLMDNHYHLLLSEKIEGGMTLFLRKLNVGYANYFNEKYRRSGTLFQGRTKKVLIAHDAHFLHILNYIHCNPLDRNQNTINWREAHVPNLEEAHDVLENYRWSSYLDYQGSKNFPSVINKELFEGVFPDYQKEVFSYLGDSVALQLEGIALE